MTTPDLNHVHHALALDLAAPLGDSPISASARAGLAAFCRALQAALGENLISVALYGSAARGDFQPEVSDLNVMVVLERAGGETLRALLAPVLEARRAGIAPFLLTMQDLHRAAALFPGKFMAIREDQRLLLGRDVLAGLAFSRQHLKLRCEQEVTNMLLQLRRRYLLAGGHGLIELLTQAAGDLVGTLRVALTLLGCGLLPRGEVIEAAAQKFSFAPGPLQELEALRRSAQPPARERLETLFSDFLTILECVSQKLERIDQVI